MKITWIDISNIVKGGEKSPKHAELEESILKYGFLSPIIMTSSLELVDGANRLATMFHSPPLQKKYENKVPCLLLDITTEDKNNLIKQFINKF